MQKKTEKAPAAARSSRDLQLEKSAQSLNVGFIFIRNTVFSCYDKRKLKKPNSFSGHPDRVVDDATRAEAKNGRKVRRRTAEGATTVQSGRGLGLVRRKYGFSFC